MNISALTFNDQFLLEAIVVALSDSDGPDCSPCDCSDADCVCDDCACC